jgi:hypothetical protein
MFYARRVQQRPATNRVATRPDGLKWTRLLTSPFLPHGKPGQGMRANRATLACMSRRTRDHLFYQGNNDRGRTWYLSRVKLDWTERGRVGRV